MSFQDPQVGGSCVTQFYHHCISAMWVVPSQKLKVCDCGSL